MWRHSVLDSAVMRNLRCPIVSQRSRLLLCVSMALALTSSLSSAQSSSDTMSVRQSLRHLMFEQASLRPSKNAVLVYAAASGRTVGSTERAAASALAAELGLRSVVAVDSLSSCPVATCDWSQDRAAILVAPIRFTAASRAEVDVVTYSLVCGIIRPTEMITVRIDRVRGRWRQARVIRGVAH